MNKYTIPSRTAEVLKQPDCAGYWWMRVLGEFVGSWEPIKIIERQGKLGYALAGDFIEAKTLKNAEFFGPMNLPQGDFK